MGSMFGSQVNPTPSAPIVGGGTQQMFFNSLYNMGMTPTGEPGTQNGQPIMKLASMPSYQGQLTPDLNNMMANNVWNSWTPQAQGMSQLQGLMGNYQSQMNPNAGAPVAGMATGQTQGNPLSFLNQYLGTQPMQGHLPPPMRLNGLYGPGAPAPR